MAHRERTSGTGRGTNIQKFLCLATGITEDFVGADVLIEAEDGSLKTHLVLIDSKRLKDAVKRSIVGCDLLRDFVLERT